MEGSELELVASVEPWEKLEKVLNKIYNQSYST